MNTVIYAMNIVTHSKLLVRIIEVWIIEARLNHLDSIYIEFDMPTLDFFCTQQTRDQSINSLVINSVCSIIWPL